jgi:hypothetical protein
MCEREFYSLKFELRRKLEENVFCLLHCSIKDKEILQVVMLVTVFKKIYSLEI